MPVWLIYAILLPLLLALTGRAVFALFTRRDDAVSRFIWWFWTVACQFILVPSFAFMVRPLPPAPSPGVSADDG